jgi:hypothetical protein
MGIATDVLNLRRNQFSSITTLIAALERLHEASSENRLGREFQVYDAADAALVNVAAHAAQAMFDQQPTTVRTQRAIFTRPRSRRFNPGPSALQRPLFAASGRVS